MELNEERIFGVRFCFSFSFRDFISLSDSTREEQQAEGEKEAGFPLSGESDVGLDSRTWNHDRCLATEPPRPPSAPLVLGS